MTEPRKQEPPPDSPRASDIADAQAVADGRLRWADVGPAAHAILRADGYAPPEEDEAE